MGENRHIVGIVTGLFLLFIISCVKAVEVESVTVKPGEREIVSFNLDAGERFKGSFIVSGGGNDIDFLILGPPPNYDTIVNLGRASQEAEFEFTAFESGAYLLYFKNYFSSEAKTIELSYEIHSTPKIKAETIFLFIVIALLIIIIIVYVLWWR